MLEMELTEDLELRDKRLVVQDNALVTASYTMTLDEKRLLVASIAKLDPTSKAWMRGSVGVTIHAKEWANAFGVQHNNAYHQLKTAADRLYERDVLIYGDSKKGKSMRWIHAKEWDAGNGCCTIYFADDMLRYLTSLFDEYTQYKLLSVRRLTSFYDIRFYELCSQFKSTKWRHIEISDLRVILHLQDKYQLFSELRRNVIEKAVKAINKKTNLSVEWEPIKKGRTVTAIRLAITEKDQLELPGI